jgi:hypothetical protein
MLRLDDENTGAIDSDMEQNLLERSINKLDDVNLVILSDYGKGVLTDHFLKAFLPIARQKGVRVLVDPKRTDYTAYTGAAAITPNRPESELAIKHSLISDEDFEKVKKKIIYCKGLRKSNVVEEYLLKGKVRCNDCDENMWVLGGSDRVGDKIYRYYYCGRDMKNERGLKRGIKITNKCLSSSTLNNKISRDKLEDIVWNVLFEILNNSEEVKKEYYSRWKNDKGSKDRFSNNLRHLNEKLNGYKEKLIISTKKNIEGLIDDDVYKEVKKIYEKDVMDIQNEINKLNEEKNKSQNIESIDGYLELMKSDLDRDFKIDRFKDKRRIIEKYIESIKVKYIQKFNNYKEYNIVLNMFLNDENLIGDKREVIIENDKNKYNFYILKFKST